MRSLIALLMFTQASLAGFLTDGNGGYLLDDHGGRILVSDNVHTLTFFSTWGTGQSISVWFDVKADKSGIVVWGEGKDSSSPVVSTEIVHVLPSGATVSLAKCSNPVCDYDWSSTDMTVGQANEILFYMTNAAGAKYGASTRISKPQ